MSSSGGRESPPDVIQGQNPNENKNQQRKPWQTRNINATQIQNKNKSSTQMSHDDLDNFGFEVEATSKSENWM